MSRMSQSFPECDLHIPESLYINSCIPKLNDTQSVTPLNIYCMLGTNLFDYSVRYDRLMLAHS